jgi:integrase/recombinase XerD
MPLLLEGTSQRFPAKGDNVIRLDDGEKGLSDRTIARRLATLSGLYGYLSACNLIGANPSRPAQASARAPTAPEPEPPH